MKISPVIASKENGTTDHRTKNFYCDKLYARTQSATEVRNAFQQRFGDRNPPPPSTILRNVRKYLNAGTSLNLNKGNSGRRRTIRTAQNIDAVKANFHSGKLINIRGLEQTRKCFFVLKSLYIVPTQSSQDKETFSCLFQPRIIFLSGNKPLSLFSTS
jgi:hypothetical protein